MLGVREKLLSVEVVVVRVYEATVLVREKVRVALGSEVPEKVGLLLVVVTE